MGINIKPKRKNCPFKLAVPEIPQECEGSRCMLFMNKQDECAIKMLARLAGNLYDIPKATSRNGKQW